MANQYVSLAITRFSVILSRIQPDVGSMSQAFQPRWVNTIDKASMIS